MQLTFWVKIFHFLNLTNNGWNTIDANLVDALCLDNFNAVFEYPGDGGLFSLQ